MAGAITKLIEAISGAIGQLWEPRQMIRIAKANAKVAEITTKSNLKEIDYFTKQMESEVSIPFVVETNGLKVDFSSFEELEKRAEYRERVQKTNKQKNIEDVILNAVDEFKEDEIVSDEPLNIDWVNRFINETENINDETMQKVWGKILAGEIRRPGSFALRTFDVLRNMSTEEAVLFAKVCKKSFIINKERYISDLVNSPICYANKYEEIMLLSEIGLVNAAGGGIVKTVALDEVGCVLMRNDEVCFCGRSSEGRHNVLFELYGFTKAGNELASIVGECMSSADLLEFGKMIKSKFPKVAITAHEIVDEKDGRTTHAKIDILR